MAWAFAYMDIEPLTSADMGGTRWLRYVKSSNTIPAPLGNFLLGNDAGDGVYKCIGIDGQKPCEKLIRRPFFCAARQGLNMLGTKFLEGNTDHLERMIRVAISEAMCQQHRDDHDDYRNEKNIVAAWKMALYKLLSEVTDKPSLADVASSAAFRPGNLVFFENHRFGVEFLKPDGIRSKRPVSKNTTIKELKRKARMNSALWALRSQVLGVADTAPLKSTFPTLCLHRTNPLKREIGTRDRQILLDVPTRRLKCYPGLNWLLTSRNYNRCRHALPDTCFVCLEEMEDGQDMVWCRSGCGKNVHKDCWMDWVEHFLRTNFELSDLAKGIRQLQNITEVPKWLTNYQLNRIQCLICRTPWNWQPCPCEDMPSLVESVALDLEALRI